MFLLWYIKCTTKTALWVQLSGIKYIHDVWIPLPPISRMICIFPNWNSVPFKH
jgi:hypothetical protein